MQGNSLQPICHSEGMCPWRMTYTEQLRRAAGCPGGTEPHQGNCNAERGLPRGSVLEKATNTPREKTETRPATEKTLVQLTSVPATQGFAGLRESSP